MPELPEVEITCRSLKIPLMNNIFTSIVTKRAGLRYPFPEYLKEYLVNYKVIHLYRKAKYIIIVLENSFNLIIHLGMSGRLKIMSCLPAIFEKHDHVIFTIQTPNNNHENKEHFLIYNDPRRFGLIDIIAKSEMDTHAYFKHLGPDLFEQHFTLEKFINCFKTSTKPLKHSLLDQKVIVGVGNIYACEALFQAKLSPYRAANSLNRQEYQLLYEALHQILSQAIQQGGSSFKDYYHLSGEKGQFQSFFKVYDQEGHCCIQCKNAIIQRTKQQGRSTFYCAKCQQ